MPLNMSEESAVAAAVYQIARREGSSKGVQSHLRFLGAHSEQARRLTELAEDTYQVLVREGALDYLEEREVSVQVDTGDREINVVLKADRLPITTFSELVEFYDIDTDVWKPTSQLFNFWGSSEAPNFQVKANFRKDEYAFASKEDREAFREWASTHSPSWSEWTKPSGSGEKMFELVLSDLHLGKAAHGEGWWEELKAACQELIRAASNSNPLDIGEAHIVLLGDTLNSEGRRATTTAGTPQDDALDWRGEFTLAREFVADVAEYTYRVLNAPVHVHIIAGNHDFERSYYLTDSLWGYFRTHPGVKIDLDDGIRKYIRWGKTLIGLSHGESIKPIDLAMTMFQEGSSIGIAHRQWHLGHYHTRREEEVHGVLMRWFGTPSSPGEWEVTKGYNHNKREVVGILHDVEDGEVASFRRVVGGN